MKKFEKDLKEIIDLTNESNESYVTLKQLSLNLKDVRFLQEKGYLYRDPKTEYIDGDLDINLTGKGLTYFYDKKAAFWKFIVESVFTPIIISVITTLLTLWIKALLFTR